MKSFFREPVFFDPTGRRGRRLRRAGVVVVAPTSAYLVLMVSSVLGGPTIDTPLLPPAAIGKAEARGADPVLPDSRVEMPLRVRTGLPGTADDVLWSTTADRAAPPAAGEQPPSTAGGPVGEAGIAVQPGEVAAPESRPTATTGQDPAKPSAVLPASKPATAPKPAVPKVAVPKPSLPVPGVAKPVVPKPVVPKPAVPSVVAPVTRPLAPVVKPVVEQVVKPVVAPVVKQVVKPVVAPVVKPVVAPVVKRVVKPVVAPVVKPVVAPVVKRVKKAAVKPVLDPVVTPVVGGLLGPAQ